MKRNAKFAALGVLAMSLAVALGSCKRTIDTTGIGRWSITRTTKADAAAAGVCQPTELPDGRAGTWCFGMPSIKIAGAVPEVHAYFLGDKADAHPIEIQWKIRGCREVALLEWLRKGFGKPIEERAARSYWQNGRMFLAAMVPESTAQCLVRMLPLSERGEIERIRKL